MMVASACLYPMATVDSVIADTKDSGLRSAMPILFSTMMSGCMQLQVLIDHDVEVQLGEFTLSERAPGRFATVCAPWLRTALSGPL